MDENCFFIIATILGVLILIALVIIVVNAINMKGRIDDICDKLNDDCL